MNSLLYVRAEKFTTRRATVECILAEITQKRSETTELGRRLLLPLAFFFFVFTVACQEMVETGLFLGAGF